MDDDDYWNTSETKAKAFSFDDDVLSPQEILAIGQKPYSGSNEDRVLSSSLSSVKRALVPLASLVSPKVLDLKSAGKRGMPVIESTSNNLQVLLCTGLKSNISGILIGHKDEGTRAVLVILAQSGKDPAKEIKSDTEESVDVTLKRLVLGRSCSLHLHRSLKSKTELLDGAIAIGDGDAVLTVVMFLIQTLNKKLVYEMLSSRPLALGHYIGSLQSEGKIAELADLLTMLGRIPDSAINQFHHIVKSQGNNLEGLLRKLSNLLSNHFNQPGVDAHQAKMVADYVKLLEWQSLAKRSELNNRSALECLAHCCARHWTEGAGTMMSPLTLCQRQQISPLQFDWVVLNVHAISKKWDIVESLFTKKDWLGRTTVSSHIPIETLLSRLSELKADERLLATCVNRIAGADDRLRLAQKYKIHTVVIEILAKQKDRAALMNYKMALDPQSEEYIYAENTLRDNSIKWKN